MAAAPVLDPYNAGLLSLHGPLHEMGRTNASASVAAFLTWRASSSRATLVVVDASLPAGDGAEALDAEYREAAAVARLAAAAAAD